jgi:phage tail tape-measure protein
VKIASEYEDLNFNWLIKGKGSMLSNIEEMEEPGKVQFYATSLSNMQILLNEKDKVISSQRETIDALKQVIDSYQKKKK